MAEVIFFKKIVHAVPNNTWEFNCKSNKNIKSYHMLYENIVSNLYLKSKEILCDFTQSGE